MLFEFLMSLTERGLRDVLTMAKSRGMALVDMVIRLILEDRSIRKHGLLTFNRGDFVDVCRKYQIEML